MGLALFYQLRFFFFRLLTRSSGDIIFRMVKQSCTVWILGVFSIVRVTSLPHPQSPQNLSRYLAILRNAPRFLGFHPRNAAPKGPGSSFPKFWTISIRSFGQTVFSPSSSCSRIWLRKYALGISLWLAFSVRPRWIQFLYRVA